MAAMLMTCPFALTGTFCAKAATGYWDCFDPTNGFFALRGDVLSSLPLHRLASGYFFEISLLGELYLLQAVISDVPIPARYGEEKSSLSIGKVLVTFPWKLAAAGQVFYLVLFSYSFFLKGITGLIIVVRTISPTSPGFTSSPFSFRNSTHTLSMYR